MSTKSNKQSAPAAHGAQSIDHGKTRPGEEMSLDHLMDTMGSDALDALEGTRRMFTRVSARFEKGEMSWDEFSQTVNGVCEHLSEIIDGDIYIRQYNDEENAVAVIRVLVDDQYLVGRLDIAHHAIMKAPTSPPRDDTEGQVAPT